MQFTVINTSPGYSDPSWMILYSNLVKILIVGGVLWTLANTFLALFWYFRSKKENKVKALSKQRFKFALAGLIFVAILILVTAVLAQIIFPLSTGSVDYLPSEIVNIPL